MKSNEMRPLGAPYIAHESRWDRLAFVMARMVGSLIGDAPTEPAATHEERPVRGQSSEPVELRPGTTVREQARVAEIERWAWRRVRSMRAFFTHLTIFVGINFILFLVDSATPGHAWFYIPLMSWGLLLALHGLHAYDLLPWTTQGWEQRKVRELIITRLRAERDLKD